MNEPVPQSEDLGAPAYEHDCSNCTFLGRSPDEYAPTAAAPIRPTQTEINTLLTLLEDRERKHDEFRTSETAVHEGRATEYYEEMGDYDSAHAAIQDWANESDNLTALLSHLRGSVHETTVPNGRQFKIAAQIAHALYHIMDDWAEENAQTGEVTIEIPKDQWLELNRVIDLLGDDPHETLHDLIGVNSPVETGARCAACGHLARYHFDDGHGNVVCRFLDNCQCVHRSDSVSEHSAKGLASAGSSAAVNPRETVGGSAEPSGRPVVDCGNPVMINTEWYGPCTRPSGHDDECSPSSHELATQLVVGAATQDGPADPLARVQDTEKDDELPLFQNAVSQVMFRPNKSRRVALRGATSSFAQRGTPWSCSVEQMGERALMVFIRSDTAQRWSRPVVCDGDSAERGHAYNQADALSLVEYLNSRSAHTSTSNESSDT